MKLARSDHNWLPQWEGDYVLLLTGGQWVWRHIVEPVENPWDELAGGVGADDPVGDGAGRRVEPGG